MVLSVRFLPGDAPLTRHIVTSYNKHHAPVQENIPEDQEIDQDVMMVFPQKGIMFNKSTPVIRKLGKPTVTMMPLDLAPNQYFKTQPTSP